MSCRRRDEAHVPSPGQQRALRNMVLYGVRYSMDSPSILMSRLRAGLLASHRSTLLDCPADEITWD
jgi:hypothetical protein